MVRPGVEPQFGCLYEPSDVLVAVEIKNSGSFTKSGIETIKDNFDKVAKVNAEIKCCYVTLAERKGYKWAVTTGNLGYPAFTLFMRTGSKNINYQEREDWRKFLDWLAGL